MINLMLRFEDETQAVELLAAYRRDGAWITASHSHALDVIGQVVTVPAVIDPDTGDVMAPPVMDPRFHVNLRLLVDVPPAGLGPYIVNPSHPARVWA